MTRCDARMRPFPNTTEVRCEHDEGHVEMHEAVLRNYAYPGSETVMKWLDDDRRTYRGDWPGVCDDGCILPRGHRGRHAA